MRITKIGLFSQLWQESWTVCLVETQSTRENPFKFAASVPVVCSCLSFFPFFWPRHVACEVSVPRPGIELAPSAVKARSPNHWTARKFPAAIFLSINSIILH